MTVKQLTEVVNGRLKPSTAVLDADILEVSKEQGNALQVKEDGLYYKESIVVDGDSALNVVSGKLNVVVSPVGDNILQKTAEGLYVQTQGNPHNTTTSEINEGTKLFFTEDRVNQTVLTGLDTSTATPALATDQLLTAIGKLQAQINNMINTASYPSFTGNAGKVLTVNATEDGVEWVTISSGGEMHFTTLAGSVDYVGTEGDQILLSDNSIVDITTTDMTVTFNAPSGKHIVKLVASAERNNYVSVGGEALVELHNFPTLSTVTSFNFATYTRNALPNLTKVPNFLPSNIINVGDLFSNATNFNQDISMWDVSNVSEMVGMFNGASSFNQDLNNWNVSSVTSMGSMFEYASAFDQPLNNWDVSNVTSMGYMFVNASAFNQDLNNWNVSSVTSMSSMFANANSFNQDLNNWNVSSVTDMDNMFDSASSFNQDLNSWNVSNVTSMGGMFYNASAFNQDISNWNVSNVTNMSSMFDSANSFNQDLNSWNVSNVTSMVGVFNGASAFNQPLNNWNVSSVTDMRFMFYNASAFDQDLSNWCVSNFPTMPYEFDLNATNWTLPRPVWGTCPAP